MSTSASPIQLTTNPSTKPTPSLQQLIDQYSTRGGCVPELSSVQLDEFRESYNIFDKDKDGLIGVSDIIETFLSLGYTVKQEDAKKAIAVADPSSRGALNFPEFITFIASQAFILSAADAATPEKSDLVISHGARVKEHALCTAIQNIIQAEVTPQTLVTWEDFKQAVVRCYLPWSKDEVAVRAMFDLIAQGNSVFTVEQLEAAM